METTCLEGAARCTFGHPVCLCLTWALSLGLSDVTENLDTARTARTALVLEEDGGGALLQAQIGHEAEGCEEGGRNTEARGKPDTELVRLLDMGVWRHHWRRWRRWGRWKWWRRWGRTGGRGARPGGWGGGEGGLGGGGLGASPGG